MKRRYHVLNYSVADDEEPIDAVESELDRLRHAGHPDFQLYTVEGDERLTGHVYVAAPDDPVVTLVRDLAAETWYLMVEGLDDGQVDRIAGELSERLPVRGTEELRQAAEAEDAKPRELVRLALGTNGPADPATIGILESRLRSPEPRMRAAAMEAASLTQWPELVGPLETAAATEAQPDLKQFAAGALAALRQALSRPGQDGA
ncbi:hypothetical protein [Amycolatopsis melonis]|uniref:hypothetical protein n=1 Tax=Amycolatopsis melonis TaxID=3156488 RepID=UPI0032B5800A